MNKIKNDAPGMKGQRSRNENGLLRAKRSDTHVATVEQQYNIDLDVNGNKHLGTYLAEHDIESLNDLITGQ